MPELLLNETFLQEFQNSIYAESTKSFIEKHKNVLEKLDEKLKKVEIPIRSERDGNLEVNDLVCQFICGNFLDILKELSTPFTLKLETNSLEDRFRRELLSANFSGDWKKFYDIHEWHFDNIIYLAGNQKKVHIIIEWNSGKKYLLFHHANQDVNRVLWKPKKNPKSQATPESDNEYSDVCCFPNKKNKPKSQATIPNDEKIAGTDGLINVFNKTNTEEIGNHVFHSNRTEAVMKRESSRSSGRNEKSDLQSFEDQLGRIVKANKKTVESYEEPPRRAEVHRTPSLTSTASNWSTRRDRLDESFRRQLSDQKARHEEELRGIRAERERLQKEADEELRILKEKSAERLRVFFQCVALKLRWEEQEQQWEDWLKTVRAPVQRVKTKFFEVTTKSFSMLKYENEGELHNKLYDLQRFALLAYDKLDYDFGELSQLAMNFEDKLFIKVAQEKISTVATKLCLLIESIDDFENTEYSFKIIRDCLSAVDARNIPTASELRSICKTARPGSYQSVSPPKLPKSNSIITEI